MDNTDGHPIKSLARFHRVAPAVTIGLALLAGSTGLSAQQYIAERINDAYQASLHNPQTAKQAVMPIAQVKNPEKSAIEKGNEEKMLKEPKQRPIRLPEG